MSYLKKYFLIQDANIGEKQYLSTCQNQKRNFFFCSPFNIEHALWNSIRALYDNVEDIDPFTGGMSEDPIEGGLIGAMFACIIGEQFKRLKDGDRFFFTHPDKGSKHEMGLPAKVKAAVRRRRLGDILCDNTDAVTTADLVMQISGEETNCTKKPKLLYEDIVDLISQPSTDNSIILHKLHNIISQILVPVLLKTLIFYQS